MTRWIIKWWLPAANIKKKYVLIIFHFENPSNSPVMYMEERIVSVKWHYPNRFCLVSNNKTNWEKLRQLEQSWVIHIWRVYYSNCCRKWYSPVAKCHSVYILKKNRKPKLWNVVQRPLSKSQDTHEFFSLLKATIQELVFLSFSKDCKNVLRLHHCSQSGVHIQYVRIQSFCQGSAEESKTDNMSRKQFSIFFIGCYSTQSEPFDAL